ncbi:MAG TPA: alanine racemase [Bacteriovoracaceae bacterium]|nr:alanine racemase [Bacteriovoracaceae bacterium]
MLDQHIKESINRMGSSFYFYDLDAFETHMKKIRATLHPDIKVWYACKANPLSEVLKILKAQGFGVDVASLGELTQAVRSGLTANNLIATGPAKTRNYLASLLQAKVKCIVVESINQLRDLNELCGKLSIQQSVLLRIQLDWDGDKSILGGSAITPFGLGLDDWKEFDLKQFKNINVDGLHCFQWGNILEIEKLEKIWTQTIESAQRFVLDMGIELKVLDLGGGLGLSYSDETEVSFAAVHETLLKLKTKYELQEIWLELGRFSIGKFGSYLTRIVDIKTVRGKNIIVTEGGINHMARPALVNEPFPCEAFMVSGESKRYSVHGPLCTALDTLGDFDLPETLKVGDWLKFTRCGAYGLTESMPYFLCHNLVGEAIVYKGDLMIPRVAESNLEWMV